MSLLSVLPLRLSRLARRPAFRLPAFLFSLSGGFWTFLALFCLLQCASVLMITLSVNHSHATVETARQLHTRQALLENARVALLTASDNSHRAGIWFMQDKETGSVDSWKPLAASAATALAEAQSLFSRYGAPKESALSQSFNQLTEGLQEQLKSLNDNTIDGFFMVPMEAFQQQFSEAWRATLTEADRQAGVTNDATLHSLTESRNLLLFFSLLLLAMLATAGWLLLRGVLRPLNQAASELKHIAIGNLNQPLAQRGRQSHEMAQLWQAMTQMQQGLQHIVREINAIADAVMQSAEGMVRQSDTLNHSNQQQSSAFAHISARLSRMAEEVENSSRFTHHATQQVQHTDSLTQRCGEMVSQVDTHMQDIVLASGEIAGIVNLLEGLSLQTRMLALNAAIESAHAGVYGRGFSVVAKEIGLLSNQSSHSTREIDRRIQHTHQHIATGSERVQALEALYGEIRTEVSGVVVLLAELEQNAAAQSQRVGKIAAEIARMAQQVEENEALSQQSGLTSQTLIQQAQRLSQSVRQFSL